MDCERARVRRGGREAKALWLSLGEPGKRWFGVVHCEHVWTPAVWVFWLGFYGYDLCTVRRGRIWLV